MEYLLIFVLLIVTLEFLYRRKFPNEESLTDEENLALFRKTKAEYLKSGYWRTKRLKILKRDQWMCKHCGSMNFLQTHHMKDYDKIPNEPTSSLVTLCNQCHKKFHRLHGYPKTYKDYITWNKSYVDIKTFEKI